MRVVFLDVDGVLNHRGWYGVIPGRVHRTIFGRHEADIDPSRVELLKRIIDQGSSRVVISSSWRKDEAQTEALLRVMERNGIPRNKVVGRTPKIKEALRILGWNAKMSLISPRGVEIHAYLKQRAQKDDIESFVILDDNEVVFRGVPNEGEIKYLSNRFIKTDASVGLTPEEAQRAVDILNKAHRVE